MELVRSSTDSGMLRFTYYVKPEFEARKIKESMCQNMYPILRIITIYWRTFISLCFSLKKVDKTSLKQSYIALYMKFSS